MKEIAIRDQLTGLEPSMATQIENTFAPMVATFKAMESEIAEVVDLEQSPEKSAKAKRLRLDIAKVRIAADKVRKEQKEGYLRAGNAIQGAYNILKLAANSYEDTLKAIEQHYELIEAARVQALYESRVAELSEYSAECGALDLGNMAADAYQILLSGYKSAHDAAIAAEEQAEKERVEAEEARRIEEQRIRDENEKLRAEKEKAEKARLRKERELKKEQEKRDAALLKERKAAEAERVAQEKLLQKEREERKALELKIAAKKAEQERKEQEAKEAAEAERLKAEQAPEKEKLLALAVEITRVADAIKSESALVALRKAYKAVSEAAGEM